MFCLKIGKPWAVEHRFELIVLNFEKNRAKIARAALPDTWLRKWAARVLAMGIRQQPVL